MGVSFKVARKGRRYRRKSLVIEDNNGDDNVWLQSNEGNFSEIGEKVSELSNVLAKPRQQHSTSDDFEVSFSLNLFPNGFSVGKVSELFNNVPAQLYPYDRASETLISAIEYGWLPGDALDDLPFKYVSGCILCQIQDYRDCLFHEGGVPCTRNNPTVHRVILQMGMENVVKDVLSISDDSWTYKDLLGFESHILKALQPDLSLNLKPLQYKQYREPLAKKVNLEIAWSWKRRKHHDARASNHVFSNSSHVFEMPGNSVGPNPNLLSSLVHQDKGVMWAKEDIPTSVLHDENNLLQETNSDSYLLTSQPSWQYGENRDLFGMPELSTPNVFAIERSLSKRTSELTPSLSNPSVKGRCQKQAVQSSIKKPKIEPVDYSFQQFPGKAIEISAPLQLQWKKNPLLNQHIEAEKALQYMFEGKDCHSQFIKNGHPENHEDIPINSQAGSDTSTKLHPSATYTVKLDPAEACYPTPGFRSTVQSQNKLSSRLIKTNNPYLNMLRNATNKRKSLEKPQLTYDGSALANSRNVDSLQLEASAPYRWNTNPPKGFSRNVVDSNVNMSNVDMANANNVSEDYHLLSQPLEIRSDPVLESLQKIGGVNQRYELAKKSKLDHNSERKQFCKAIPMVVSHLSSCEESIRSEETAREKVSLSKLSMGRDNVSNSRTLLFIRNSSPYCQGDDRVDNRVYQVRLVLETKLNKDTVEANVAYGCEDETNAIVYSIRPAFPNAHSADLFASQFTSVMAREGYDLYSDIVKPMNRGLTHNMLSPMPGEMLAHYSRKLPLKKTYHEVQSLPSGNIQSSSLELGLPDLQLDAASQFCSMPLPMPENISRRAHLQPQVQQLVKQQEQLWLRTFGGSRKIQHGNGIQGLGNLSHASFANVTGNGMASRPRIVGGRMRLVGNMGPENNRCSNALGINDSKLLVSSDSDYMTAISSKPGTAEGKWRGSARGVPIQSSDLVVPMYMPKAPEIP